MYVEVDSRMQSSIMTIYCLTINMVVVQHPARDNVWRFRMESASVGFT